MKYSLLRHACGESEAIRNVQSCQEVFINNVEKKEVGRRLVDAFKETLGIENKEDIAKLLGYKNEQSIYKLLNGTGELPFERLLKFRDSTKRSIDWLLTGEGEPGGTLDVLNQPHKSIVQRIAEIYGLEVGEVINKLVQEALLARVAEAAPRYLNLQDDQREEIATILDTLHDATQKKNGANKNNSRRAR